MIGRALAVLRTRPDIAGNPRAQEMLEILQNGDSRRGEEVAGNILKTYGVTKEQALAKARRFFGL